MKNIFIIAFLTYLPCHSMNVSSSTKNTTNSVVELDGNQLARLGFLQWNNGDNINAIYTLGAAKERGGESAVYFLEQIYQSSLRSLVNNLYAPLQLAILCENGWGVKKNIRTASLWYQIAGQPLPKTATTTTTVAQPQTDVKEALARVDSQWRNYSVSQNAIAEVQKEKNRLNIKLRGSIWGGNKKISQALRAPVNITSYITGMDDSDGFHTAEGDSELGPIFKKKVKENYGYDIDGGHPCYLCVDKLETLYYQKEGSEIKWELNTKQFITELNDGPPIRPIFEMAGHDIATTKNRMGDIRSERTYIIDQYEKAIGPKTKVLDIGTGTGKNAYSALKKGALVTALDLSLEHLNYLLRHTPEKLRNRLWLNTNSFPEETNFLPNSKNVVLMSHVPHYLEGEKLRLGLKKIHEWLDDNGILLIQTLSPYSKPFVFRALEADALLEKNEEWPGYFLNTQFSEGMPDSGHPLHPLILERELKNAGFAIKYINYGSFDRENTKAYPVAYKEIENYFKNLMSLNETRNFETRLAESDPWLLGELRCDKQLYENMLAFKNSQNSSSLAQFPHEGPLKAVNMVQAIAVKVK